MIFPVLRNNTNIGYLRISLPRHGQFVFGEGSNALDVSVSSVNYQIDFALHWRTSLINKIVFLKYVS